MTEMIAGDLLPVQSGRFAVDGEAGRLSRRVTGLIVKGEKQSIFCRRKVVGCAKVTGPHQLSPEGKSRAVFRPFTYVSAH
jgi:hypothetical protein